jgi:hypothetical protein
VSSSSAPAPDDDAHAPRPAFSGSTAAHDRFEQVPETVRDALRKLDEGTAAPALAFFSQAFGGRAGAHQIVLETDAHDGSQIVLKLDFDNATWKRVRKRAAKV